MSNPKNQAGGKKLVIGSLILLIFAAISLTVFAIFRYLAKRKKASPQGTDGDPSLLLAKAETIKSIFVTEGLSDKESGYWTAVSAHETGGWTSEVYKSNNNMFGMKQPEQRDTTSEGEKNGYASYKNEMDSILDLLLWINARQFPKEHDSIRKLTSDMKSKGYFEANYLEYTNAVLKWHAQLFNS